MDSSSSSDITQSLHPEEAAHFLGITTRRLNRLRIQGKVHGEPFGKLNLYTYKIADLRKADLSEEKRGPKPKKSSVDKK